MRRYISALLFLLAISLAGCATAGNPLSPENGGTGQPSEDIAVLEEGIWSENEYTDGLPQPPGSVAWVTLDAGHGNCSVNITDISESDFAEYVDLLKQSGFSAVENDAEVVGEEGYTSENALLSDGERWLSLSYIPDSLTIYISFEKI